MKKLPITIFHFIVVILSIYSFYNSYIKLKKIKDNIVQDSSIFWIKPSDRKLKKSKKDWIVEIRINDTSCKLCDKFNIPECNLLKRKLKPIDKIIGLKNINAIYYTKSSLISTCGASLFHDTIVKKPEWVDHDEILKLIMPEKLKKI